MVTAKSQLRHAASIVIVAFGVEPVKVHAKWLVAVGAVADVKFARTGRGQEMSPKGPKDQAAVVGHKLYSG